jgi:hypothetical protein
MRRMLGVRQHFLAGFLTLAAFLGAHLHVGVVGELLALLRTARACVDACLTDQRRERPLAGDDLRRGGAYVGAILAGGERRQMLVRAFVQLVGAVRGARVTSPLAIAASLGAGGKHVVAVMLVVMLVAFRISVFLGYLRETGALQRGEGQRRSASDSKLTSTDHGRCPHLSVEGGDRSKKRNGRRIRRSFR